MVKTLTNFSTLLAIYSGLVTQSLVLAILGHTAVKFQVSNSGTVSHQYVNIKIEKHLHTKNTHLVLFPFFKLNCISPKTANKNIPERTSKTCLSNKDRSKRKKHLDLRRKKKKTKPFEDTARWQPLTNQGEKPQKDPNLLSPRSWISSLQN